ncbi:MAG: hypothetical protein ACXW1D_00205 [Halobacteriota archaeon]
MSTQQEMQQELETLVMAAYAALRKAEAFADTHSLDFRFSPEYGMGGYYDGEEGQWNPSSQSC